jgi:uncharacterized protein (DUF4213/DUF364 family)
MTVARKLRELASERCGDIRVQDVRIGLGYTGVQLEDGRTGVSYTLGRNSFSGCSAFKGNDRLTARPASELLNFLGSPNPIDSSLGLAAANALVNVNPTGAVPGDILQQLNILPTDRVGMVGYFRPLVAHLENRVASLEIFEENEERSANLRPAAEEIEKLPSCQVAIVTSTTIINNTIDDLLNAARACREVCLVGPSTPLLPDAFNGTPVTYLSGMTVRDSAEMLRVISEGRGTRFFTPFAIKWNIRLKPH